MTPTRDDRIAELLVRHHLGEYDNRPAVARRLGELFTSNPPDVLERLERACDHLNVTGHHLEHLADYAVAQLAATHHAATRPATKPKVRQVELPAGGAA